MVKSELTERLFAVYRGGDGVLVGEDWSTNIQDADLYTSRKEAEERADEVCGEVVDAICTTTLILGIR